MLLLHISVVSTVFGQFLKILSFLNKCKLFLITAQLYLGFFSWLYSTSILILFLYYNFIFA